MFKMKSEGDNERSHGELGFSSSRSEAAVGWRFLRPRLCLTTSKCFEGGLSVRLKRINGDALQTIRRRWFRENPLCVHCAAAGRVRMAAELDHVVPLFKGGADDNDNRQGLCRDCHAIKTRDDMGHGPSAACDVNGWPIDPRHSWNKK